MPLLALLEPMSSLSIKKWTFPYVVLTLLFKSSVTSHINLNSVPFTVKFLNLRYALNSVTEHIKAFVEVQFINWLFLRYVFEI